jgi:hypothetical protein
MVSEVTGESVILKLTGDKVGKTLRVDVISFALPPTCYTNKSGYFCVCMPKHRLHRDIFKNGFFSCYKYKI